VAVEALLSIVDSLGYRALVDGLAYGERLPTAVYVHRETPVCSSGGLGDIVRGLAEAHGIGDNVNVVKFRRDAPRLSFLSYPGFHDRAHPELSKAVAIDFSCFRQTTRAARSMRTSPRRRTRLARTTTRHSGAVDEFR
jgi:hypothetical protein